MRNTKCDVALMNNSPEKIHFHDLMQYLKYKFFAFLRPQYVFSMFSNFGHFSASCSYKKGSYKKGANNTKSVSSRVSTKNVLIIVRA